MLGKKEKKEFKLVCSLQRSRISQKTTQALITTKLTVSYASQYIVK